MTDELTPDLKKAINDLPREHMPAGLEARVTGAMRDHGFLERKRRSVAITNSRMAGVLAACMALVIGAYSIGFIRGGDQVLPGVQPMSPRGRVAADEPAAAAPEMKTNAPATMDESIETPVEAETPQKPAEPEQQVLEKGQPTFGEAHKRERQDKLGEVSADRDQRTEGFAGAEEESPTSPNRELSAPAAGKSLARSATEPATTPDVSKLPMTFLLSGSTFVVEAPDSVRVTMDERGQMLLIFTSDGVIRIRLADDN